MMPLCQLTDKSAGIKINGQTSHILTFYEVKNMFINFKISGKIFPIQMMPHVYKHPSFHHVSG